MVWKATLHLVEKAKFTRLSAWLLIFAVLTASIFVLDFPRAYCSSTTHKFSYTFYVENGWLWENWEPHTLYVSVTQSLYEYYQDQDHGYHSANDYLKFVIPEAVKPIAERVWSICQTVDHSEEQFVNAILMVVHQIPYRVSSMKYPIETIVENIGDCDVFSVLTASILKAKGMDVVLLDWIDKSHMNIGVYLPETPIYCRGNAWYMPYNSKKYYIAECTGYCTVTNATSGWRVGECPSDLQEASANIIPLDNVNLSSPAKVSASIDDNLSPSYIVSLAKSSPPYYVKEQIWIQGTISPAHPGEDVVLYYKREDGPWKVLDTAFMDSSGTFTFTFTFNSIGTYYVRASWSGDSDHEGVDSDVLSFSIEKAPSYIYLTLSSNEVSLGESILLTGYISPAHSYQDVNLYYSQDAELWFLLATTTTDSEGCFLYSWAPESAGTFYFKAEWLGDSDHQGAESEIWTLNVTKAQSNLTLILSATSINLGEIVTISGEISPVLSNVQVYIYISENGNEWALLTSTATNSQGRYSYLWSPATTGTYYVKAYWSGDANYKKAESSIATLQVDNAPPTSSDSQNEPTPPPTPAPTPPDGQNEESQSSNYLLLVIAPSLITILIGIALLLLRKKTN